MGGVLLELEARAKPEPGCAIWHIEGFVGRGRWASSRLSHARLPAEVTTTLRETTVAMATLPAPPVPREAQAYRVLRARALWRVFPAPREAEE